MNLVNDQDDIAAGLDLRDQALHAAFELAPELGARHQSSEIQQENLLVPQLIGHIPRHNSLGQAFCNGCLANAGLAHQAGIVLLAAVQDLDDPFRLHVPADDLVQLALPGPGCQVHAIVIQKLMLALFFLFRLLLLGLGILRLLGRLRKSAAKELIHQREGCGLAIHLVAFALAVVLLAEHTAHFIGDHI